MTNEMEYLMHLYARGAKGEPASPPKKSVDWNKIVYLAANQSITYTVAMAIKTSETGCPEDIKSKMIAMLRGGAIKNTIKREGILKLVNKMKDKGIDVIIIKGFDVSRFYANPECRVSSDTDLLIRISDEKKAVQLLKQEGFKVEVRNKTDNHSVAARSDLGMVELHVKLLPDVFNLEIFDKFQLEKKAINNRVKIDFYDMPYYGLNVDDSIAFLTYHMMKHLMASGMSLRMIMDIALYAKYNIGSINKDEYEQLLKKTHYYYTMQLIFGMAVKYFGFSENDFPITPVVCDEKIALIINDLEEGGWQGVNVTEERFVFWNYYLRKRTLYGREKKRSYFYLSKKYWAFNITKLFVSKEELARDYPLIKQHSELYLLLSMKRIIDKVYKRVSSMVVNTKKYYLSEDDMTDIDQNRLYMLKRLEIM